MIAFAMTAMMIMLFVMMFMFYYYNTKVCATFDTTKLFFILFTWKQEFVVNVKL
jgi:hypothetical protein